MYVSAYIRGKHKTLACQTVIWEDIFFLFCVGCSIGLWKGRLIRVGVEERSKEEKKVCSLRGEFRTVKLFVSPKTMCLVSGFGNKSFQSPFLPQNPSLSLSLSLSLYCGVYR